MSNEEITYEQVLEYCKKRNLDLIDHAFLVRLYNNGKAIPVEWIMKYSRKEISVADYWALVRMVKKWERENDKAD